MMLLKPTPIALTVLLSCALSTALAARGDKPARDDARRLTGVLKSVDAKHGTFTLEKLGADVDEVLTQKLKERGASKEDAGDAKPREKEKTRVVAIDAKTKIYVKFRSSPSVANNAEQQLKDLERMVGYPVSVMVGREGEPPVAAEVIAWRGTPMRIR